MTHAFVALAHGRWHEALRYNALAVPLFAAGLLWLTLRVWEAASGRRLEAARRLTGPGLALYVLALAAYGIWRMATPTAWPY